MSRESTQPVVIDETNVAQQTDRVRRRSSLVFALAVVLNIIVLAIILSSRVGFRRLVEDFDIVPSPITSFALGLFLPALLALVLVATVAAACIPASRRFRNSSHKAAIGITLACLVAYIIGILTPLLKLMESLS